MWIFPFILLVKYLVDDLRIYETNLIYVGSVMIYSIQYTYYMYSVNILYIFIINTSLSILRYHIRVDIFCKLSSKTRYIEALI